nr:mediator of RNA polymerase II transcription subunit 15A isoform X1 [Tanacetum cinerariifolium]
MQRLKSLSVLKRLKCNKSYCFYTTSAAERELNHFQDEVLVEDRAFSRAAILNRPSQLNAITTSMAARLQRLYESWEDNSQIGFVTMKKLSWIEERLGQLMTDDPSVISDSLAQYGDLITVDRHSSPIQPLRLLVPANYPNCSPILLDKFPAEVRSLSQPMSLKEIAKTWDVCARAVISDYAQQNGGGTFSSKYGGYSSCVEEDIHHVLFRCEVATAVMRRVCRWWTLDWQPWSSFSDWNAWFSNAARLQRLYESWEDNSQIGFVTMKKLSWIEERLGQLMTDDPSVISDSLAQYGDLITVDRHSVLHK